MNWRRRVSNSSVISCKFTEEKKNYIYIYIKKDFPSYFTNLKAKKRSPGAGGGGRGLHTASYYQIPDSNVPARE